LLSSMAGPDRLIPFDPANPAAASECDLAGGRIYQC
jgi:hypothetical protein